MKLKPYFKLILIVLLISGLFLHVTDTIHAQEPSCVLNAKTIEPTSGFNLYTVLCSLNLEGQVQIQMLDRGNELDAYGLAIGGTVPVLDPHNEVWIFDYFADGQAELIVDFHKQDAALVADLYDQQGPRPPLSYQFTTTGIAFQQPQTPTVQVTAPDGWWFNGKIINFNLDMTIDGLVGSEFDIQRWFDYYEIKKDGKTDFIAHIRDTDGDGRPDDDWRIANISPRPGLPLLATASTNLVVNTAHNENLLMPTLPWAYLGAVTYGYLSSVSSSTGLPPIQVDWAKGVISYVGEFVTSRGNDHQWFVYSFNPLIPGQVSQPNFEAPFAWYDLADDHDSRAELAVRVLQSPPFDRYFLNGTFRKASTNVRYSWDQNDDGFWDYKLGLLSNTAPDSIVELPELNLKLAIPAYNDIPNWVTGQPWDIATFVAAEDQKVTGEGIYEWDIPAYVTYNFFTGYLDLPLHRKPDGSYDLTTLKFNPALNPGRVIDPGLRGEYAFTLNRQPKLYISAVDGKLHLSHAEGSYWDTGGDSGVVRGSDMDGDGYQDTWRYLQNDVLVEELVHSPFALIHDDTHSVTIQLTSIPNEYSESIPPATHTDWVNMGQELSKYNDLHLTPGQFGKRLDLATGPRLSFENATASDFRTAKGQLRFVIELASGFTSSGDIPNTTLLSAGKYLVEVGSSGMQISPLKPADVMISSDRIIATDPPEALTPVHIGIDVKNAGDEDVYGMRVTWSFIDDKGTAIPFSGTILDVLGGEQAHVQTYWTPPHGGDWQIEAAIITPGVSQNPAQLTLKTDFDVKTPLVNVDDLLTLNGELPLGGLLVVIFGICLIVSAPIIFVLVLRNRDEAS